jgi:hypothetical protein
VPLTMSKSNVTCNLCKLLSPPFTTDLACTFEEKFLFIQANRQTTFIFEQCLFERKCPLFSLRFINLIMNLPENKLADTDAFASFFMFQSAPNTIFNNCVFNGILISTRNLLSVT